MKLVGGTPEVIWNFEGLDTGAHFWYDNQHRRIVQVTTLNGQKDRKTLYAGGLEQEYRYDESYDVTGSAYDDWRPLYTHKSSHSDDTGASTGRSLYFSCSPRGTEWERRRRFPKSRV